MLANVDFQRGLLRIRDRVEGERIIPLTPNVSAPLRDLKARSEVWPMAPRGLRITDRDAAEKMALEWKPSLWAFPSASAASGKLKEPRTDRCLTTIHRLRRSFGTLADWCEVPVG